MATTQMSSITLPELLFEKFTRFFPAEEGEEQLQVFNTLTYDYSKEDIRRIIEDISLRTISCSSNERAVDILILRAQALREKKKHPAVIVVRSELQAGKILSMLDEQLANARVANLFKQIKRKRNHTIKGNPDFILCSYHKLFKLLAKDDWETVSGVVFLAPLSRTKYRSESILLDQILNMLPKRTAYSFIHGEELRLRKEEFEWLFAGSAISYQSSEYSRYDLLKDFQLNIFEDRNLVTAARRGGDYPCSGGASYLLKLILTLTFHRRMNRKHLLITITNSICYKLWYAFEQSLQQNPDEIVTYSPGFQLGLVLLYLTDRCRIKLLERRNEKDGYYHMTDEGRKFFKRFCFSDGLVTSLFYILHALSRKLEKGYLSAKDFEDLMNDFTGLDVIWDVFYLDDNSANHEVSKALKKSYTFRSAQDIFEGLDEDFGLLAEAAKKSLAAQKTILKEQIKSTSPIRCEQEQDEEEAIIDDYNGPKITKIYSKEFLEDRIQEAVSKRNIIPSQFATDTGLSVKIVRDTLERLNRKGVCSKITTNGVPHKQAIYGTEENLEAEPHLAKTCDDNCISYDYKTNQCITNRLRAEVAYSSLTIEQQKRAYNPIRKGIRACDRFQEAHESRDFTLNYSEFGLFTQEIVNALSIDQKNSQKQFRHLCLICSQQIKAFGSKEKPFFTSKTITCPNCNSRYIHNAERDKVRCLSDTRNIIRSIFYYELAYVPEILKQKEERIPLTIGDDDTVDLHSYKKSNVHPKESSFKGYFLLFNDRTFALSEVERVYFPGKKHQELEDKLKQLGFTKIYRKKAKKQASREENIEQNNAETPPLGDDTKNSYRQIIAILRAKGVMINPSLISKINSVITFIWAFSASESQRKTRKNNNFNKELGECTKILMRAKNDVTDPDAARLLEGQAFKQAFRILKKVGRKAGIRSWGRVVSRLVTWLVFAVFTRTCAYSQLDSMLNHLFKIVLNELKEVHQKVGIDFDLGPGLIHYRKSKSDIDRIGLFLDLVDFVRLIVIFVLADAISTGEITGKDCRLFLGRGSIPLYDIKLSSLKKFEVLAEKVLTFKISYKGQEFPLKEAYEDYLKSFRLFLDHLSKNGPEILKQLSRFELEKIVEECLEQAYCLPISFRIKDFEEKLEAIDLCSNEWKFLYEGFEDKFLARKQARKAFQGEAMANLFGEEEKVVNLFYNSTQEKYRISLTKYQKRERRWIFYVLLIFILNYNKNQSYVGYTICDFMSFLGLKYKRTRLLLKKMHKRNLLKRKIGINMTYVFSLNIENKTIELLINLLNSESENKVDFYNIKEIDEHHLRLLALMMKQYLLDFLEKSTILRIDQNSSTFESIAREFLVKINNRWDNYFD